MLKVEAKNFGTVAILCLQGRMVRGEIAALRMAVNSQSGVSAVVLDLGRVSTVDAGGLGLLLELREQTQATGIDFKIMNVGRLLAQVLEITQLNSVFEVTTGTEILSTVSAGPPMTTMGLRHACCP
jgi:anti-anti-sigma factor